MNKYEGELKIRLYDKDYPMKINMRMIAAFESETGLDFNYCAVRALNAYSRSRETYDRMMDIAESMAKAVPMKVAAWAFYLAAREYDKCVTFEEIQEAVMLEGVSPQLDDNQKVLNYPSKFVEFASFALVGNIDKKK